MHHLLGCGTSASEACRCRRFLLLLLLLLLPPIVDVVQSRDQVQGTSSAAAIHYRKNVTSTKEMRVRLSWLGWARLVIPWSGVEMY